MKRIFKYFSIFLCSFMLFCEVTSAASYSISVTSNSVTVGNSITLKITGSDVSGRFKVTSSNSSVVSVSNSSLWVENNTQTVTLKTSKVGTAKITVAPYDVANGNGVDVSLDAKSITITVKEKVVEDTTPKVKSTNNYLSSLSISGIELEEKFNKETLEYNATIPAETEKIKINAQLADSSASVVGTGEVKVSSGLNTLNIVVTAENGSKRTYVIKATVLELEPIEVEVDNDEYTVVRKRKDLPEISDYFVEKQIKIGEDKVEGYYNEKLDYTLVGLKDTSGNIEYYIYDENKYALYKEYTFAGTTLQILDKSLDDRYKKTSFTYDGDKIDSYQEVKLDIIKNTYALDNNDIEGNQFYLFYAKNVESGKEQIYQYDAVEKTVQRYNTLILDMYKDRSDTYYMYLLGSILIIGILIIIFSIITIVMSKKGKKRKRDPLKEW